MFPEHAGMNRLSEKPILFPSFPILWIKFRLFIGGYIRHSIFGHLMARRLLLIIGAVECGESATLIVCITVSLAIPECMNELCIKKLSPMSQITRGLYCFGESGHFKRYRTCTLSFSLSSRRSVAWLKPLVLVQKMYEVECWDSFQA